MKTVKFFSILLLSVVLMTSVTACKGEDGTDGQDGATGAQGPAGQDGNANVIYSDWFAPTWTVPASSASFTHAAAGITQEVLDTGVIMVYMKIYDHVYPLPISFNGDTIPKEFNFWADLGSLRIWFTAESSYSPSSTMTFRYIIIPGSNAARITSPKQAVNNELATAGVDINDYYAVCAYYGINPE